MFTIATSSAWAPQDQFEALRSTLFEPKRLVRLIDARHDRGSIRWSASFTQAGGAHFSTFEGDALQTLRPRRADPAMEDAVVLTWVRRGNLVQEYPDGTQVLVPEGGLQVYDTTRPMRFHWSAVRDTFLILPRNRVVQALGGQAPITGRLPAKTVTLAPFLCGQLDLLARHGPGLTQAPLVSAMDAAVQLALACLREAADLMPHAPDGSTPSGVLAAAHQYMRQHLHDSRLDAQAIAQAAGCSRTRLYEAFAAEGKTVMGTLRELRLQHARTLLEQSGRMNVEALAWRCGFPDRSNFSRLFKSRFGAAPSEWPQHTAGLPD